MFPATKWSVQAGLLHVISLTVSLRSTAYCSRSNLESF